MSLAADGRVVAYMGDDERFDYIYKFVSSEPMRSGNGRAAREHNLALLDEGTLYVARFNGDSPAGEIDGTGTLPSDGEFDGTGEWIPLVDGDQSLVTGMSVDEVLINTRLRRTSSARRRWTARRTSNGTRSAAGSTLP